MNKNYSRGALLICASLIILSIAALTAFAETETGFGCPESTGGYIFEGNRDDESCKITTTEHGYWWYIKGEVKWVGTVFAGMKGEFKEAKRETVITGIQYKCDGLNYNKCWVCNCYSLHTNEPVKD